VQAVYQWLETVSPVVVCLIIGLFVMVESLGIPFPAETVLIATVVLVSQHALHVPVLWIAIAASLAAIIGDSIGFGIGHRWGQPLFDWLGRKVPKHFGPSHLAYAERIFTRWGMVAVFFGRFIALLRTFSGPLAGALKMPYPRFLVANVAGGICWASGMTALVYYLGQAASKWFGQFSWIALGIGVVAGIVGGVVIKRRTDKAAAQHQHEAAADRG